MSAIRRCEACEQRPPSIRCRERLVCYSCSRKCQADQPHPHVFVHHGSILEIAEQETAISQPLLTSRPHQLPPKENNSSLANLRLRTGYSECQSLTERHNSLSRYVRMKSSERNTPQVAEFIQASEKHHLVSRPMADPQGAAAARVRHRHTQTDGQLREVESFGCQTTQDHSQQETIDRLRKRLKQQRQKNVRQNEGYKQKLQLIRSCMKPELLDLERLISENERLRERLGQLEADRSRQRLGDS